MKRQNVNRTNNFPRISVSSLKMSFPLLSQLLLKFFIYDKYLPEKKKTRRNVLNKKTGSKEILIWIQVNTYTKNNNNNNKIHIY